MVTVLAVVQCRVRCVVVAVVVKVLYVIRGEWQCNEECAGNGNCLY